MDIGIEVPLARLVTRCKIAHAKSKTKAPRMSFFHAAKAGLENELIGEETFVGLESSPLKAGFPTSTGGSAKTGSRCKSFTEMMPVRNEQVDANIAVPIIAEGWAEPAAARIPTAVTGIS